MARTANPDLADRRRRQIMDAALACFRRRGFHQTSMQEICAEAGLSAGALYRYFPAKTDIITAIAEADRRENEGLLRAMASSNDLVGSILHVVHECYTDMMVNGDAPLVAEVLAEAMRDQAFGARLRSVSFATETQIADAVRRHQREGRCDPTLNADAAARLILGALDGMAFRFHTLGEGGLERIIEDLRVFLDRLLRPIEKPPISHLQHENERGLAAQETA